MTTALKFIPIPDPRETVDDIVKQRDQLKEQVSDLQTELENMEYERDGYQDTLNRLTDTVRDLINRGKFEPPFSLLLILDEV